MIGLHVLEPFLMVLDTVHGQGHNFTANRFQGFVLGTQAAQFRCTDRMKGPRVGTQDGPLTTFPFMKGRPMAVRGLARKVRAFVANAQDFFVESKKERLRVGR